MMQAARARVLWVLPRLVVGGVERVSLQLAHGLADRGMVCAFALRRDDGALVQETAQRFEVHRLGSGSIVEFVPALARLLRAWRPTHVVTAFGDVALLSLVALRLSEVDAVLVHGVHNVHFPAGVARNPWARLRQHLYGLLAAPVYARADAVVAVSAGIEQEIRTLYRRQPRRLVLIHNPVVDASGLATDAQAVREPAPVARMVAMGRLEPEKGFDLLVDALARLDRSLSWSMDIWGDGGQREALRRRIRAHGLEQRVHLRGVAERPMHVLQGYGLLVMASRCEGFGNVLVEAMAAGLQVVAVDCPYGPREILLDGRIGVLVARHDLVRAMARMLRGESLADAAALRRRAADFTVQRSVEAWAALLDEAVAARRSA